jgi:hypothetical protein
VGREDLKLLINKPEKKRAFLQGAGSEVGRYGSVGVPNFFISRAEESESSKKRAEQGSHVGIEERQRRIQVSYDFEEDGETEEVEGDLTGTDEGEGGGTKVPVLLSHSPLVYNLDLFDIPSPPSSLVTTGQVVHGSKNFTPFNCDPTKFGDGDGEGPEQESGVAGNKFPGTSLKFVPFSDTAPKPVKPKYDRPTNGTIGTDFDPIFNGDAPIPMRSKGQNPEGSELKEFVRHNTFDEKEERVNPYWEKERRGRAKEGGKKEERQAGDFQGGQQKEGEGEKGLEDLWGEKKRVLLSDSPQVYNLELMDQEEGGRRVKAEEGSGHLCIYISEEESEEEGGQGRGREWGNGQGRGRGRGSNGK